MGMGIPSSSSIIGKNLPMSRPVPRGEAEAAVRMFLEEKPDATVPQIAKHIGRTRQHTYRLVRRVERSKLPPNSGSLATMTREEFWAKVEETSKARIEEYAARTKRRQQHKSGNVYRRKK